MAEIIQCYREAVPAMRFIGRKYDGFTSWGECFSTDTFGAIERAMGGVEAVRALWKDGGCIAQCEFGAGANPDNVYRVYEHWNQLR